MSRDRQTIDDMLIDLPVAERLAVLAGSLLMSDARGSISNLVECALIMAGHLSPTERAAISFGLRDAAAKLDVQWQ
jgi:hypothetical protein